MNIFERLGGRKLVFMLLAIGAGVCIDLYSERGLSANLKELMIYVGGLYILGNVGSKTANAVREKNTASKKELESLRLQMEQLNANQNAVYQSINTNTEATTQILKTITS